MMPLQECPSGDQRTGDSSNINPEGINLVDKNTAHKDAAGEDNADHRNSDSGLLNENHVKLLAASGISAEHAALRGYETVTRIRRMEELGFSREASRRVPGLLVPLLDKRGATWGYQFRPDNPYRNDGKIRKYETPVRQRNGIDVPRGVGEQLDDPDEPLWVTEGSKKADCAAAHGLCIVSLLGVWNWRGTNAVGGKVALADWDDIALNDRQVIMAYDGDAARKPSVRKAMDRLAGYLVTKGARVSYLHLPDTEPKTGVDDYLSEGYTVEDLWWLVKPTLPPLKTETADETPADMQSETPKEPPPFGSIDGAALLDELDTYLSQYIMYPNAWARHAHTLWIAHTHLMDCWDSTPRFACLSPEPASGKTRALEVTEPVVPRPVHAVNVTSAYLFRKISDPAGLPTILYDEIDTVFGKGRDNEEVRGLINAGHRSGAVAGRCVTRGDAIITEELPAFCPVMMAGLNDLPDTIMTRTIVARMKKRAPSETVKPWRQRVDTPIGRALGLRLADWADSVRGHASQCWPEMPDGVDDRNADAWEPLLAVADLAGGQWPETARVAAVAAVADSRKMAPTLGVMLLRDTRAVFSANADPAHLITEKLLTGLIRMDEAPWATIKRDGGGIDSRLLAKLLGRYGIKSRNIRGKKDAGVHKGYHRADFTDAWERYLPNRQADNEDDASNPGFRDASATSATPATPSITGSVLFTNRTDVSVRRDVQSPGSCSLDGQEVGSEVNGCSSCHQIPCRCVDLGSELAAQTGPGLATDEATAMSSPAMVPGRCVSCGASGEFVRVASDTGLCLECTLVALWGPPRGAKTAT